MKFALTNLSFDFGQKRATAGLSTSEQGYGYLNITLPIEPPANMSADALENYILSEIRKAVQDAADFTHDKKG